MILFDEVHITDLFSCLYPCNCFETISNVQSKALYSLNKGDVTCIVH